MKENTTWQTVYEQLQEIQYKIGDRTLSTWCVFEQNTSWEDWLLYKHTIIEVQESWRKTIIECNWEKRIGYIPFSYNDENREPSRWIIKNIIWHPISLARVLSALGKLYFYDWWLQWWETEKKYEAYYICKRKLLNKDNSDCMLSDQSPETIKAIWEIVCK